MFDISYLDIGLCYLSNSQQGSFFGNIIYINKLISWHWWNFRHQAEIGDRGILMISCLLCPRYGTVKDGRKILRAEEENKTSARQNEDILLCLTDSNKPSWIRCSSKQQQLCLTFFPPAKFQVAMWQDLQETWPNS